MSIVGISDKPTAFVVVDVVEVDVSIYHLLKGEFKKMIIHFHHRLSPQGASDRRRTGHRSLPCK